MPLPRCWTSVLLPQGTSSSCSERFPTTDWAFAVWRPTWSFCSFLAGFMKTVKSITTAFPNFLPALLSALKAYESGYGRQLADALEMLQNTHSQKLFDLLSANITVVMNEDYTFGSMTQFNASSTISWLRRMTMSMT